MKMQVFKGEPRDFKLQLKNVWKDGTRNLKESKVLGGPGVSRATRDIRHLLHPILRASHIDDCTFPPTDSLGMHGKEQRRARNEKDLGRKERTAIIGPTHRLGKQLLVPPRK